MLPGARGFHFLLVFSLITASCGGPPPPPQQFEPLHYEYLTKLRLDVARIDVDDNWAPRGGARHVEYLSPVQPLDALRQMANDRLIAGGNGNHGLFTIEDASIIQSGGQYQANLAVRLDIVDDNGNRRSGVEARVTDVHPMTGNSAAAVRGDLYALTRQAMEDMNVEFEYQIRHNLEVQLQPTSPTAPPPAPVGTEELGPPGASPPAGPPPAGLSPAEPPPGGLPPAGPPPAGPPSDQGAGPRPPTPLAPPPPASMQPPAGQPPPAGEPSSDEPAPE